MRTVKLREEVYDALVKKANIEGASPEGWIENRV